MSRLSSPVLYDKFAGTQNFAIVCRETKHRGRFGSPMRKGQRHSCAKAIAANNVVVVVKTTLSQVFFVE